MRCIEIIYQTKSLKTNTRLIETWDVLKCANVIKINKTKSRLIETWDVLKF